MAESRASRDLKHVQVRVFLIWKEKKNGNFLKLQKLFHKLWCMWWSVIIEYTKSWQRAGFEIMMLMVFVITTRIPTFNTFAFWHRNLYCYTISWDCNEEFSLCVCLFCQHQSFCSVMLIIYCLQLSYWYEIVIQCFVTSKNVRQFPLENFEQLLSSL